MSVNISHRDKDKLTAITWEGTAETGDTGQTEVTVDMEEEDTVEMVEEDTVEMEEEETVEEETVVAVIRCMR